MCRVYTTHHGTGCCMCRVYTTHHGAWVVYMQGVHYPQWCLGGVYTGCTIPTMVPRRCIYRGVPRPPWCIYRGVPRPPWCIYYLPTMGIPYLPGVYPTIPPWVYPAYTLLRPVHAASYDATLGAVRRSPGLKREESPG